MRFPRQEDGAGVLSAKETHMQLAAIAKMGYYPTPSSLLDIIASYMTARPAQTTPTTQPAERFIALDPCCGKGEALARVAARTGITETWGAELSAERAAEAARVLSKTYACAWQWCRVGRNSISMLFLNPPYDDDNTEGRRLELGFLEDSVYTLLPGGGMVYIIPQRRLDKKVSRFIAARFEDIRVYRFPEEEFKDFSQIVVFGRKKGGVRVVTPSQEEVDALFRLSLLEPEALPELAMQAAPLYELPPAPDKDADGREVMFRRHTWDEAEVVAEAAQRGVLRANPAWHDALAQSQNATMRPAMPLKKGHVAMLMASGLMGIQRLTATNPDTKAQETVLVKGRVVKHQDVVSSVKDEQSNETATTTRDKFVTTVAVMNAGGELIEISEQQALGAFMREYGDQLAASIVGLHIPGYDMQPTGAEMSVVNGLALNMRLPGRSVGGLLPTQKHVAIAAARAMRREGQCLLNAEMGTGKTVMGASILALLRAWPAIVICPPHLVRKWAAEIERAVPGAVARVVNCVERGSYMPDKDEDSETGDTDGKRKALPPYSIFDFAREYEAGRLGDKAVAVVSTTRAGLGSGWNASAIVKRVYVQGPDHAETREYLADPETGEIIERRLPGEKEAAVALTNDAQSWAWLNQQPRYSEALVKGHALVRHEDSAIWRRESRLPHRAEEGKAGKGVWGKRPSRAPLFTMGQGTGSYLNMLRYGDPDWTPVMAAEEKVGFRRVSIAEIVSRKLRHFFKCCIKDEAHQFKARDTDRSVAAHRISRACKYTLDLTGTFFGGRSTSIFYMAHRLSAVTRQHFDFGASQRWAEKFGVLQVTRYEKKGQARHEDEESGAFSALKRSRNVVKELPGLSPAVIAAETGLLNQVIFVKVADLGYAMPAYEESVVSLAMTDAQREQYEGYIYGEDASLQGLAMDALKKGSQRYLSLWLQWSLARPNSAFRDEVVEAKNELAALLSKQPARSKADMQKRGKTGKGADVEAMQLYELPAVIGEGERLPKEQWLVDYVMAEKAQGRKVLVYCRQTGTRDIQPRIVEVLKAAGLRAAALPSSIAPENREKWIGKNAGELDALITNPRLVETGLDLVMFHTIVFCEVEYSLYTLWQACRRVWRLGQTREVKVIYLCYEGTMEEKALSLIGRKMYAAQLLYGDEVGGAIVEADEGSMLTEMAREALSGTKLDDLSAIFAEQNKALQTSQSDVFAVAETAENQFGRAREGIERSLRFFLSDTQRLGMLQALGEKNDAALALAAQLQRLEGVVDAMPRKNQGAGLSGDSLVSLRYTLGEDEWYVLEREMLWAQSSPLGLERKKGRAPELKPLSFFEEALRPGAMLDLDFEPCPLGQLLKRLSVEMALPESQMLKTKKALALLDGLLARFMGVSQREAVRSFLRGEEGDFYADKMIHLAGLIEAMPRLYATETLGDDAPVTLRYFHGSATWYAIEREDKVEQGNTLFAYASLWGQDWELGYTDLDEIIEAGAELDFHFEPRPLGQVKAEMDAEVNAEVNAQTETEAAPKHAVVLSSASHYHADAPASAQDTSWEALRKTALPELKYAKKPVKAKTTSLLEFSQLSLF